MSASGRPRRRAISMPLETPGTPTSSRYVGRRLTSSNSTAALSTPGAVEAYAFSRSWCVVASVRRSEEHTSELQSRLHLVCRLLLEKKKTQFTNITIINKVGLIGLVADDDITHVRRASSA